MQITIKFKDEKLTMNVDVNSTIMDIKSNIEKITNIPVSIQFLFFQNCFLEDEFKLEDYRIKPNSVINLLSIGETTPTGNEETDSGGLIDEITDDLNRISLKANITNGNEQSKDTKTESSENVINDEEKEEGINYRGICVIISNEHFQKHDQRRGNNFDEAKLKDTFNNLQYKIKTYNDVVSKDMARITRETKAEMQMSSCKMLVMFILSHGDEDTVIFTDGEKLSFECIWRPFTNERIPIFAGKPKLFFFVCCQGDKVNPGVNVCHNHADDNRIEHDGDVSKRERYPSIADMFFGYATCRTFVSGRKPNEGTLYITSFCNVLQENSGSSVSDIHQEVQRRVSQLPITNELDYQMPYFTNLLTEHAYFKDDHD